MWCVKKVFLVLCDGDDLKPWPRAVCNAIFCYWFEPLHPSSLLSSNPLLCRFDIQTVKWQFTLTRNSTELNSNQLNCFCRFRRQHHIQKLVTCATQHIRFARPNFRPTSSVSLFLYAFSRISNVAYSAGHLKLDVQACNSLPIFPSEK